MKTYQHMFLGEANAFAIEIASAMPQHLQSFRSLIESAFECFPECDYCVLSCPTGILNTGLLQYFVRVTPKPDSNFPHELHVLHRLSFKGTMQVRPAVVKDLLLIQKLVKNIVDAARLLRVIVTSFDSPSPKKTYVYFCEQCLIGVAVIRPTDMWEYVNTHYQVFALVDVNKLKNDNIGLIDYFVISPVFEKNCAFFLREIHRLTDYDALFYILTPDDTSSQTRKKPLAGMLRKSNYLKHS